jgi:hypothetical protein
LSTKEKYNESVLYKTFSMRMNIKITRHTYGRKKKENKEKLKKWSTFTFVGEITTLLEGKGKAIPLQAWTGPECSRRYRLPGGKFVSPTHRPPLPPRNYPWYQFLLEAESTPES